MKRFDYYPYRYTDEKRYAATERWLKETNHVRVPLVQNTIMVLREMIQRGCAPHIAMEQYNLTTEQLRAIMDDRWVAYDTTPRALREYLNKDEADNQDVFDTALASHLFGFEVGRQSTLRRTFSDLLNECQNYLSDEETDYDRVTSAERIGAFFMAVREHYS